MSTAEVPALGCDFCGKASDQVHNLVSGPGVRICDECVRLCVTINADNHDGEHGLRLLADLTRASDVLVARLKAQHVPWSRIAEALRPTP